METKDISLDKLRSKNPVKYFQEVLEVNEFEELQKLVVTTFKIISWDELARVNVVKIEGKTVEGIYWRGDLVLEGKIIESFWKIKEIKGTVYGDGVKTLKDIGELSKVEGTFDIEGTPLEFQSQVINKVKNGKLNIDGFIYFGGKSALKGLLEEEFIPGDIDLKQSDFRTLRKLRKVKGNLLCIDMKNLQDFGVLEEVKGNLYLQGTSIELQFRAIEKVRIGELKVGKLILDKDVKETLEQIYLGKKLNFSVFRNMFGDTIHVIENLKLKEIGKSILLREYERTKEDFKEKGNKIRKENEGKKLTEIEKKELREIIMKLGKKLKKIRKKIESFGIDL